jgi:hypothetical protein
MPREQKRDAKAANRNPSPSAAQVSNIAVTPERGNRIYIDTPRLSPGAEALSNLAGTTQDAMQAFKQAKQVLDVNAREDGATAAALGHARPNAPQNIFAKLTGQEEKVKSYDRTSARIAAPRFKAAMSTLTSDPEIGKLSEQEFQSRVDSLKLSILGEYPLSDDFLAEFNAQTADTLPVGSSIHASRAREYGEKLVLDNSRQALTQYLDNELRLLTGGVDYRSIKSDPKKFKEFREKLSSASPEIAARLHSQVTDLQSMGGSRSTEIGDALVKMLGAAAVDAGAPELLDLVNIKDANGRTLQADFAESIRPLQNAAFDRRAYLDTVGEAEAEKQDREATSMAHTSAFMDLNDLARRSHPEYKGEDALDAAGRQNAVTEQRAKLAQQAGPGGVFESSPEVVKMLSENLNRLEFNIAKPPVNKALSQEWYEQLLKVNETPLTEDDMRSLYRNSDIIDPTVFDLTMRQWLQQQADGKRVANADPGQHIPNRPEVKKAHDTQVRMLLDQYFVSPGRLPGDAAQMDPTAAAYTVGAQDNFWANNPNPTREEVTKFYGDLTKHLTEWGQSKETLRSQFDALPEGERQKVDNIQAFNSGVIALSRLIAQSDPGLVDPEDQKRVLELAKLFPDSASMESWLSTLPLDQETEDKFRKTLGDARIAQRELEINTDKTNAPGVMSWVAGAVGETVADYRESIFGANAREARNIKYASGTQNVLGPKMEKAMADYKAATNPSGSILLSPIDGAAPTLNPYKYRESVARRLIVDDIILRSDVLRSDLDLESPLAQNLMRDLIRWHANSIENGYNSEAIRLRETNKLLIRDRKGPDSPALDLIRAWEKYIEEEKSRRAARVSPY